MSVLWHVVVLILLIGVPIVVVVGVVTLLVRAGRPEREERIAQRTAELLRQRNGQ